MTETAWAETELASVQLGDRRLDRRLIQLVGDFSASPATSIPAACGTAAATKAAYRFLDDEAVDPDAIVGAHIQATTARVAGEARILAIQDTTQLDLTGHRALEGVGPLAGVGQQGMLVHSVLAVSDDGVPLGLLHQQRWCRDPATAGSRHQRRQRPTAEKESQRWLDAAEATDAVVSPETAVLTVADREADIYDLFAMPRSPGHDLLIRATHNRRVDHEELYLHDAVTAAPVIGELTVTIRRRDDRPARDATLNLRCVPLALLPPRHHRDRAQLAPIPVVVVLAEEAHRPPQGDRIRWLLVTTILDASAAAAVAAVRHYAMRWLVERYHYALKQGCAVEDLQLRHVDRLDRAIAVFAIVAWRLLWLTYHARVAPDLPCTVALTEPEWQVLACTMLRTPVPPTTPPSLHQAVRWTAQLGGFLGRKGDGEPGLKVIWRGLRRLHDLALAWEIAHLPIPPNHDVGNA
jgi:hypothetical protein